MQISREDRVRMERAHVLAWPALRTANIDGWLWRSSGGGSQRANSVSTIDFAGANLETAVDAVESRYRALGAPARFQTFDETSPAGLASLLRRRGYNQGEPTITMFKSLGSSAEQSDVEQRDHRWIEWSQLYLDEITENRRAANTMILDRIQAPHAFFGCRRDGEIVATALCVIGFGCAVVECVATRTASRRQGAARSVLIAVENWAARQNADLIGLQVMTGNTPAVSLYQRLGFVVGATNSFWLGGRADG
jgi:ribosomal protein S18 acetylase RimI-like enzyme